MSHKWDSYSRVVLSPADWQFPILLLPPAFVWWIIRHQTRFLSSWLLRSLNMIGLWTKPANHFSHLSRTLVMGRSAMRWHRQPPAMTWEQIAWPYELSSFKTLLGASRGVRLQDSVTWAGFLWPLFAIENPLDFQWPCDLIKTETDFILDEILTLWSLTQNSHENPHLLSLLPRGIFFVWIFHGVSSLSTWSLGF